MSRWAWPAQPQRHTIQANRRVILRCWPGSYWGGQPCSSTHRCHDTCRSRNLLLGNPWRSRTSKTVYHSVPPAGKTKQKHHEPEQPSNLNDHIRFALRDSERPQHDNIHTRPPPLFPQTITLWWMPPPRSHGGMDCSFSRSQAGTRAGDYKGALHWTQIRGHSWGAVSET